MGRDEDGRPAFDLAGFREVDGTCKAAMPGFVDSHVHVESMMVPPDQFASTRSPILSLAGLALVVIPEVKISDLGLARVTSQQILPHFPAA